MKEVCSFLFEIVKLHDKKQMIKLGKEKKLLFFDLLYLQTQIY